MAIGDRKNVLMEADIGGKVPPQSHAGQHASGGSDPITPQSIGAASQNDLNALSSTVNGKADSGTVANLSNTVGGHTANRDNPHGVTAAQIGAVAQTDLDALSTTVSGKAEQTDLVRLSNQVSALSTTVGQKASKSTVTSLTNTVNKKVEVYLGSYDGDSVSGREFAVGFQPTAVIIWRRDGAQYDDGGVYGGFFAPGRDLYFHGNNNYDYLCAEVTSTGFKLYNANVNATNGQNLINVTNEHYYYMVFK